jgi:hypothetical protein
MTRLAMIRDYENSALPLERRLPSLAKRFTCLKNAKGLEPWSTDVLFAWLKTQGQGSAAWHAGLFILNLFAQGGWDEFDAIGAIQSWDERDKTVFATWVKSWRKS